MKVSTASPRMPCSASHLATRFAALAACAAALAVAGCGSYGGSGAHPDFAALRDAPPPLAGLYRQGDRVLPGGVSAYRSQLRDLRGHPVVVNDWASWCVPCRQEVPIFARVASRLGKRVAFLGVDAQDNDAAARTFLRERPLPYPSFADHDGAIAATQSSARGYPRTAFYDRRGKVVFVKQGPYTSAAELTSDVRRYASG